MIPKRDSSFYRLAPELRALYLTGMPKAYLSGSPVIPQFRNEKTSNGILRSNIQQEAFDSFKKSELGNQQFVIFCSSPSDHQALQCVTGVLRERHSAGFNKFEFVHPSEAIPTSPDLTKDLYILTGVHESDTSILPQVRKWARTPLGAEIWLILTSKEPCKWFNESLGVRPQFLFSFKESAISVG